MMARDPNCIFCKIVAGDIPCHKVMEDQLILAFLDIGPLSPGHMLVIPKDHFETMDRLPSETAATLGGAMPKLTAALVNATGAAGVNILQNNGRAAGQEVDHLHVHLIPRNDQDGLGYRWHPKSYATGEAEAMLDAIQQALG